MIPLLTNSLTSSSLDYYCHSSHQGLQPVHMTDATKQTSIAETEQSTSISVPSSEVEKECLNIIEIFWRSECTQSDKTRTIQEIVLTLTTATPELTSSECDNALKVYLKILEQHCTTDNAREYTFEPTEMQERPQQTLGAKQGRSPRATDESLKKQKQDNSDFPGQLENSYQRMDLEITSRPLSSCSKLLHETQSSQSPHS